MAGINDLNNVSWQLSIADLQHSDKEYHRAHGRNPEVGIAVEEDIWLPGGKEVLSEFPAVIYASCENASATVQVMLVDGLGPTWKQQYGLVTLNGQNQVAITDMQGAPTTWTRIFKAYQRSGTPDPVNPVWFAEADTLTLGVPDTAAKVHSKIEYTDAAQQTEACMFTIPSGKVGYITQFTANMLQGSVGPARDVDIGIEIQELAFGASLSAPVWAPWRRIGQTAVGTGQSHAQERFEFPERIAELTNISIRAKASSVSAVFASFTVLLIDE